MYIRLESCSQSQSFGVDMLESCSQSLESFGVDMSGVSHAVKVDVVKRLKANKGSDTHKPPLPKR